MTSSDTPLHDFLAAAAVPTNEQKIVTALEQIAELQSSIDSTLTSIETRLFAYINGIPKAPVPTAGLLKGRK